MVIRVPELHVGQNDRPSASLNPAGTLNMLCVFWQFIAEVTIKSVINFLNHLQHVKRESDDA